MRWKIAARPIGRELRIGDFERDSAPPELALREGAIRVQVLMLSCDPAQKGWMENVAGYAAPTEIGGVMPAGGVGRVLESRAAEFAPGDLVQGTLGWSDEMVVEASAMRRVRDEPDAPRLALGLLGSSGLTAYFGLARIGVPQPGDTLVVTGAGGGVGSIVGQIGKIAGCRVIGLAGGADKCRWLTDELGFDHAIDYKAENPKQRVRELAPGGIDVLWDNVGGQMLDDLLARIARKARVVICGGIARYQQGGRPPGPASYFNIVFKSARMEGFLLSDFADDHDIGRDRLRTWLAEKRIVQRDEVVDGLENAPQTLMRLFRGENRGKLLIRVAD
ncbi:NADP-dependent oxidoreductase [Novosphingobium sp. KCTC 2891]|uniref:NADP-dependent oxidoreductase n=1 Tax=Novosphingobium sp. KCTC 2891 TaxID=2989730 RepID=UPI002223A9FE|nr:NADP-dependent oxidoreductase [Novosphingobium sp. KCTC 2891]MCW1382939.1 NADP-dependent oxidoreductase [Novosphingobium sp. KCTC 2891]